MRALTRENYDTRTTPLYGSQGRIDFNQYLASVIDPFDDAGLGPTTVALDHRAQHTKRLVPLPAFLVEQFSFPHESANHERDGIGTGKLTVSSIELAVIRDRVLDLT